MDEPEVKQIETRPIIWVAVEHSYRPEDPDMATVETREFESMEAARAAFPDLHLRRLRVCTECGHPECPMCCDSCDVLKYAVSPDGGLLTVPTDDDIDEDDVEVCCDGTCTYVEPEPYLDEYPMKHALDSSVARELGAAGKSDMWSTLERLAGNPDYAVCVMAWPWPDGGWMAGISLTDPDYAERQRMSPAVLELVVDEDEGHHGPAWNVYDGFANGINAHGSDGPGAVGELVLKIQTREAELKKGST